MIKTVKILFLMLICGGIICGCTANNAESPENSDFSTESTVTGVWISYSEINKMLMSGDFASEFDVAVQKMSQFGITDAFVHVRSFCDSIVKSDHFPMLKAAAQYNYDILETVIKKCKAKNIRVHAWINPYRVRTADEDITKLPADSPARVWLEDGDTSNDLNVCFCNGIYLNPASAEVRRLILDGVRELLQKYDLAGIHFDDYFYPTAEIQFDEKSYEIYKSGCDAAIPLEDWRRANVNMLISGCYTAVKFYGKDLIFSVSPAASVQKDRDNCFADVCYWAESGCVDWVIPQLYFGFCYPIPEYCFDSLTESWKNAIPQNNVRLLCGLAAYKVGTSSEPDAEEWGTDADLLSKEAEYCRNDPRITGTVYFSYSSLFSDDPLNKQAREAVKQ